ncbi:hypothetical protein KXR87_01750, partial [Yokenella regensburgei]|uniref:hypothetical protein n=1 Tax=Yokenella regensburgei TaxID=158877 RepID=UPI003F17D33A
PPLVSPGFPGAGAMQRPCNARPRRASLRVAPALRKRVGSFQPDSPHLTHRAVCKSLKRCGVC